MELRGQDKNIGMPTTQGSNPPQPNQDPSSKLPFASIISSTIDDRRNNETIHGSAILNTTQTLDHQHRHPLLNEQPPPLPPASDPNQDPDPNQRASATIASASNSKTPQSQPQPPPQALAIASSSTNSSTSIWYRECLKNHAASMGGHVVDGCGEFMPSGEEGTPAALRCAACDCHRNFHRKEIEGESQCGPNSQYQYEPGQNNSQRQRIIIHPSQPPSSYPVLQPQQHHNQNFACGLIPSPSKGPMMMAFGGIGGAPAESSSEDLNMFQTKTGGHAFVQPSPSVSKKRFRTKFTREQKDRMHDFAEKLGWKMQKQDEPEVQHFCNEVGVKRQVLKVWMHNNKQAIKKKEL